MNITRNSLRERQLALINHYLERLENLYRLHARGEASARDALRSFDQDWQQLQGQQQWAAGMALKDSQAAALVSSFPGRAGDLLYQVEVNSALQWVEDALRWTPADETQTRCRLLVAGCRLHIHRHDAARAGEHLEELQRLVEHLDDDALRMNALQLKVEYLELAGSFEEQQTWAERALELAQRLEDEVQIATAYQKLGFACTRMGQSEPADTCLRTALALFQKLGMRLNEGYTLNNLAANSFYWDRAQDAVPYGEQALAIMREFGRREWERRIFANLALYTFGAGDLQKALHYGQQALAAAVEAGARGAEYTALQTLMLVSVYLGLAEEAAIYIDQAQAYIRQTPEDSMATGILWNQWHIAHEQGDMAAACALAEQLAASARQRSNQAAGYMAEACRGSSLCELGDFEGAADAYTRSLDFPAAEEKNPSMRATLAGYSYAQAKRGQMQHAQALFDEFMPLLIEHSFLSLDPPYMTAWNAYRAAVCLGDSRVEIVVQAYRAMLEKHLHYLHDERLRTAFLNQYSLRCLLALRSKT